MPVVSRHAMVVAVRAVGASPSDGGDSRISSNSSNSNNVIRIGPMKTAQNSVEMLRPIASPALTVRIEINPLVEAVRRHVKLTPHAARLIESDFARLFQTPVVTGGIRHAGARQRGVADDTVLSTQAAADLIGVSRPYLVARIESGDIPLHQQVGNQRRVLQSEVLAWHRREQARRRKALAQLGASLDEEIFAGERP
jgi:excisionase family DNA binding protein